MGRASATDCTTGTVAGNSCERQTEGAPDPARFGRLDDTYNAGRMNYVQIRFSGFILGQGGAALVLGHTVNPLWYRFKGRI